MPKSVSELSNEDAGACLSYATILFYKSRDLMTQGKSEEAQAVFMEVNQALQTALQRSESGADTLSRALVRSQVAFMLGDLSFYVFKDPMRAKAFYEQSVHAIADHAGARRALERLAKLPVVGNQSAEPKDQKAEGKGQKAEDKGQK